MREATMTGGPGAGAVFFKYPGAVLTDTSGNGAWAHRDSMGWWHWEVELVGGYAPNYAVMLIEVRAELSSLGVFIPELEPADSGSVSTTRNLAYGLAALLGFSVLAVVLALVHGCSKPVETKPVLMHRWTSRVLHARISDKLDPCRRASALAAITWVESRLNEPRFLTEIVPADSMSITGTPRYLEVEFSEQPPRKPKSEELATTEIYRLNADDLEDVPLAHSAEVRSHSCSTTVYIHEVLHVLGLSHGAKGTLMGVQREKDVEELVMSPSEIGLLRL